MNSGRNGITSVKPVKPMKEVAVTANRFRRQECRAPDGVRLVLRTVS
jgi:hypothetical protein